MLWRNGYPYKTLGRVSIYSPRIFLTVAAIYDVLEMLWLALPSVFVRTIAWLWCRMQYSAIKKTVTIAVLKTSGFKKTYTIFYRVNLDTCSITVVDVYIIIIASLHHHYHHRHRGYRCRHFHHRLRHWGYCHLFTVDKCRNFKTWLVFNLIHTKSFSKRLFLTMYKT